MTGSFLIDRVFEVLIGKTLSRIEWRRVSTYRVHVRAVKVPNARRIGRVVPPSRPSPKYQKAGFGGRGMESMNETKDRELPQMPNCTEFGENSKHKVGMNIFVNAQVEIVLPPFSFRCFSRNANGGS